MINQAYKDIFLKMTDREIYVISRQFGLGNKEPSTLEEIGTELEVTRERIRQIEASALRKATTYASINNLSLSDFFDN